MNPCRPTMSQTPKENPLPSPDSSSAKMTTPKPKKPPISGGPANRFCRCCHMKNTTSNLRLGDECFEANSAKDAIFQILPDVDYALQDSDAICDDCFETLRRTLRFIKTFKTISANDLKCPSDTEDQNDIIELSDEECNEGSNQKTVEGVDDKGAAIYNSHDIEIAVEDEGDLRKEEQFFARVSTYFTNKTMGKTVDSIDRKAFKESEARLFNKLVVIPRAQQPVLDRIFPDISKDITVFQHSSMAQTKYKRLLLLGNVNKFCYLCMQTFSSLYKYKRHFSEMNCKSPRQLNKLSSKPPKCGDCDAYESMEGKAAYMKKCTVLNCPHCKVKMSTCQLLEHSKAAHLDMRPFKCTTCKKDYACYRTYMGHKCDGQVTKPRIRVVRQKFNKGQPSINTRKERVKPNKYFCACKRGFLTEELLEAHKTAACMFSKRLCNICGKFFTKGAMRLHLKTHEPPLESLECEICHKKYSSQLRLMSHIKKIHLNNQEVICEYCGMKLRKSSISGHMRLKHNNSIQKYKCPVTDCGREFSRRDYMTKHVDTHRHTARLKKYSRKIPGHNEFICKFCLKTFKYIQNLKTHLISHMRLVRYKCRHCPMTYANYRGRQRHEQLSHLNEQRKGFQCNTCWKVEPTAEKLNLHVETVHKKKNYKCEYCGESFSRYFQLNTHLLAEHIQASDIEKEKEYILRKALSDYIEFDDVEKAFGNETDYDLGNNGSVHVKHGGVVSHILQEDIECSFDKELPESCIGFQ